MNKINDFLKKRNVLHIVNEIKPIYKSNKVFFHNFTHINDGLKMMIDLKSHFNVSDNQLVAWLFHDIIYVVGNDKNEYDSAKFFKDFYLKNNNLFNELSLDIDTVVGIILDTELHKVERTKESSLILDIDLSCLSGEYDYFIKGRINVLKEYAQIYNHSELLFGTRKFLNDFINSRIFITDYFFYNYEDKAKQNMKTFLNELNENNLSNLLG